MGEPLEPVFPGFNRSLRVESRAIQTEDSFIPRAAGVVSGVLWWSKDDVETLAEVVERLSSETLH